ncbi:MAG TPA: hypothetical protein PKA13_15790 [Geminicoccaceae bacterium]|nr:hypothetical protein [Geminicoccus sp.]HMU51236.1 hypothetical protein [Geminicoccaceae bacterium]
MRAIHSFRIAADHPCLAGHFPGRPIVPGVLVLDHALRAIDAEIPLGWPLRLGRVKFTAPLLPGEAATVLVGEPRDRRLAFACEGPEGRIMQAAVELA